MALEGATLATLQRWLGPITEGTDFGETEDLAERLDRWLLPELVALEILMARQAEMDLSPASWSGDSVRSSHSENFKRLEARIGRLVAAIRANADITLTDPQEALVAEAESGQAASTRIVDLVISNPRRG